MNGNHKGKPSNTKNAAPLSDTESGSERFNKISPPHKFYYDIGLVPMAERNDHIGVVLTPGF
jgi:hypothetical protein